MHVDVVDVMMSWMHSSFFQHRLSAHTAQLTDGCEAVVIFVNDVADAATLKKVGGNRSLHVTTPI